MIDQEVLERLGYSVPVVTSLDELESVAELSGIGWYLGRRRRALLAAVKFDPLKHPRGHDGRFIKIGAWVRFFADGRWNRGQVKSIEKDGSVKVSSPNSALPLMTIHDPTKNIFTLPDVKAVLPLPDISKQKDKGFVKVGGQGGSNPGGLFEQQHTTGSSILSIFKNGGTPNPNPEDVPTEEMLDSLIFNDAGNAGVNVESSSVDIMPNGEIHFTAEVGYDFVPGGGDPDVSDDTELNGSTIHIKTGTLPDGTVVSWVAGEDIYWPGSEYSGDAETIRGIAKTVLKSWLTERGIKWSDTPPADAVPFPKDAVPDVTPDLGTSDKVYVKKCKSVDHAANEVLAAKLYQLAGVPVPEMVIDPDGQTIGSRIIDGAAPLNSPTGKQVIVRDRIREDLVIDAWLANWDVVGLDFDNIVIADDGTPYRIDTGGALLYRAQGSPKGKNFGPKVGELETLRSSKYNPQAASIFSSTSDDQLKSGAMRLAAITDNEIEDAVADAGLPMGVATVLESRRDDLKAQLLKKHIEHVKAKKDELPPMGSPADLIAKIEANPPPKPTGKNAVHGLTPDDVAAIKSQAYEWWSQAEGDYNELGGEQNKKWAEKYDAFYNKMQEVQNLPHPDKALLSYDELGMMLDAVGNEIDPLGIPQPGEPDYKLYDKLTNLQIHLQNARQKLMDDAKANAANAKVDLVNPVDLTPTEVDEVNAQVAKAHPAKTPDSIDPLASFLGNLPIIKVTADQLQWGDIFVSDGELYRVDSPPKDGSFGAHHIEGGSSDMFTPAEHLAVYDKVDVWAKEIYALKDEYTHAQWGNVVTTQHTPRTEGILGEMLRAPCEPEFKMALHTDDLIRDGDGHLWFVNEYTTGPDGNVEKFTLSDPAEFLPDQVVPFDVGDSTVAFRLIGTPDEIGNLVDKYVKARKAIEPGSASVALQHVTSAGGDPAVTKMVATVDQKQGLRDRVTAGEEIYVAQPSTGLVGLVKAYGTGLGIERAKGSGTYQLNISEDHPAYEIEAPPQPPPLTFKKDGTVAANGQIVGTWEHSYWQFNLHIKPEFTVGNVPINTNGSQKQGIRSRATAIVILPTPAVSAPGPVPKKPVFTETKHAVESLAVVHGVMADGHVPIKGMVVKHVDGKFTGAITGAPNQEKYPGLIYVKPDGGGKTKIVNAKKLEKAYTVTTTAYTGPKTKDGHAPIVGMKVKTGKAQFVGTIKSVNLTKGWITVQPDDGSKAKVTTLNTTTVLEGAAPGKPAIGAPTPKLAKAANEIPEAYKEVARSLPRQDEATKKKWLTGHKPMKDGSVPYTGLPVLSAKGDKLIVVSTKPSWVSQPNGVKCWDPVNTKMVTRQVGTLSVDWDAPQLAAPAVTSLVVEVHPGSYGSKKEPFVKEFAVPEGAWVYKANPRSNYPRWYFVFPNMDGSVKVQVITTYDHTQTASSESQIMSLLNDPSVELVGRGVATSDLVIYGTSGATSAAEKLPSTTSHVVMSQDDVSGLSPEKALAEALKNIKAPAVAHKEGLPQIIDVSANIKGPATTKGGTPVLPELTDQVGEFGANQLLPDAKAIDDAMKYMIAHKDKPDPGSGAVYALTDSDSIEDMMVRFQTAIGSDGKEYIEARFKLSQPAADDIGHKLMDQSGHYGAWTNTQRLTTDIHDGAALRLRVGTDQATKSHVLKPNQIEGEPTVRVVGEPIKLADKSKAGYDVYRFTVVNAQGEVGQLDLEDRGTPSVAVYTWDAKKFVPAPKTGFQLNGEALNEGWSRTGSASMPSTEKYPDANGKKIYTPSGGSTTSVANGGSSLQRTLDDGTLVRFNYAHVGETGPIHGGPRHGNIDKEVLLRIPLEGQTDEDLQHSLSQGFEAVGIPNDLQRPPNEDELRRLAINKLRSLFADGQSMKWYPGKMSEATGQDDDPTTQAILANVTHQLGSGADPVTMDDLLFYTESDGRTWVGLSDHVADELTKKKHVGHFRHHCSGGKEQLLEILSSPNNGLLATDERFTRGLLTTGQSSSQDMANGAGDRLYITSVGTGSGISAGGSVGVIMSARTINLTTEIYPGIGGDGWGRRGTTPWAKVGAIHENMYKRTIPPEMFAYVWVGSSDEKKWLIERLKERGITSIGGRPLDEYIKTAAELKGVSTSSNEFQKLGSEELHGIPVTKLKTTKTKKKAAA